MARYQQEDVKALDRPKATEDSMKKETKKSMTAEHIEALDRLQKCKNQIDFLKEVFLGEGPEFITKSFPAFQAIEGLHSILERIGRDMEESIHILEEKKAA